MKMTDKLLKALHDTAKGLHKAGTLDAMTMRKFDALCLPPVKTYTPTQIRRLRTRYKASQAVFAQPS
jgi:putative transcriptional regulator